MFKIRRYKARSKQVNERKKTNKIKLEEKKRKQKQKDEI